MPTFVTSGFLIAGAAAAALPIVIHLLLRQRARVLPLGSVRFLKEVVRQHTRRRRIRQWILLAMRVLAVLLLAALFARPYWERSQAAGRNREVAVLVDRSASMQAKSGSSTVLAEAIRLAQEELGGLDENTAVHMGVFDSKVEDAAVDKLSATEATGGATDYAAALAWAGDLMTVSRRADRRVVLVTDMQLSGLNRTPVESFPDDVDVVIRDVGRPLPQNVSIEDCRAIVTEIRPKDPVRVRVRLYNAGALAVKGLPVSVALEGPQGKVRGNEQVDIDGGQRLDVELTFESIQTDGVYSGQAVIKNNDDLSIDNQRWLAFEARHPDRLLLVDGQQGRSVYTDESYYLETALRLRAPIGERPGRSFEVERLIWEDGEGFPSLDGYRAIVLANVRRLSGTDITRLRQYVSSGGNVLVFFGDQFSAEQARQLQTAQLFPGKPQSEPELGPWRITSWEREHPVLIPFADPQNGDLRSLRFEKLLAVDELSEDAKVLVSCNDHPLVIEQRRAGEGAAIFVMTAADRAWGDWPQHRLYVPIVRQLLAYLTSQLGDRQAVREEIAEAGQTTGVGAEADVTVVRNLDPEESLLQRISEEDFREALALPARDREKVLEDFAKTVEPPPGVERPRETWDKLIFGLLLLMAAEVLLASRVHI